MAQGRGSGLRARGSGLGVRGGAAAPGALGMRQRPRPGVSKAERRGRDPAREPGVPRVCGDSHASAARPACSHSAFV